MKMVEYTTEEKYLRCVLNVPDSYETFKQLVKSHSLQEQRIIFDKMVKSNLPSVKVGDKKVLLRFLQYIVKHIQEEDVAWDTILIMAHNSCLFFEEECLQFSISKLLRVNQFGHDLPTICDMKFLVWCMLVLQEVDEPFPARRPVLDILCRVASIADPSSRHQAITGLIACHLLLQDAKHSSMVFPGALRFLHRCVEELMLMRTSTDDSMSHGCLSASNQSTVVDNKERPLGDCNIRDTKVNEDVHVLHNILGLLAGFAMAYKKHPGSKILFKSVQNSLAQTRMAAFPSSLVKDLKELQDLLQELLSTKLPPIEKAVRKPKALRQYDPSFHFVTPCRTKRIDLLSPEKQERQKLLHRYKTEMKGAVRELRKDRVFLTNVKLAEKAQRDQQRLKAVKEILSSAAIQQAELRRLKKERLC